MNYIYDVVLNFNEDLIEFFEWKEDDDIKYIKKISLHKINTKSLKEIIENEVIIEENFLNNIKDYEKNNNKKCKVFLLTDSLITIGVMIKNNKVLLSRMLLDEEIETLEIASNIKTETINYKIIKEKKNENNYLTRREKKINNLILKRITELYQNNNKSELKYIYFEYSNKEENDIDKIYETLCKNLNVFTAKHNKIYEIMKVTKKATK